MSKITCPAHPNFSKHNCPECNDNVRLELHIGASIRRYRERSGLSAKDVASTLKISSNLYGKYENGDALPKHEFLYKLACIFNCSIANFYPKVKAARITETVVVVKKEKILKTISL